MYLHYISASPVAVRQARASQQECNNQCAVFLLQVGLYWSCQEKCRNGRGMKTYEEEDFSIPHPVAGMQAREDSCASRCVANLYWSTPAAAACLFNCAFGRKLEGKVEPVSGVKPKPARESVQECKARCTILAIGSSYLPACLKTCERRGRKSDELQDFSTPSVYPSAPAQPINPGQFFWHFITSLCVHGLILNKT